jgi:hypothetical protein
MIGFHEGDDKTFGSIQKTAFENIGFQESPEAMECAKYRCAGRVRTCSTPRPG